MISTKELLSEAESLPVEERASLADALLKTVNTPDPDIDHHWLELAKKRRDEIRNGTTEPLSGELVLKRIRERLVNRKVCSYESASKF